MRPLGNTKIIIYLVFIAALLSTTGCKSAPSAGWHVNEATFMPVFDPETIRLCVTEEDTVNNSFEGSYVVSDANGITPTPVTGLFPPGFIPNRPKVGDNIFLQVVGSPGEDHKYGIFNASLGKLYQVELGTPFFPTQYCAPSDDGRFLAVGIAQEDNPDRPSVMWIIDVTIPTLLATVTQKLPGSVFIEGIYPMMIKGNTVHAFILDDTDAYYYIGTLTGETKHIIELPVVGYDIPPNAEPLPGPGKQRYLLGTSSGFVAVSPENHGATLTELAPGSHIIGVVEGDNPYVVWFSFDDKSDTTKVWRHDLASGLNTPVFWINSILKPEGDITTSFLRNEQSLLVALDGDLWRYDMRVGIAGHVWETPGIYERLVWAE